MNLFKKFTGIFQRGVDGQAIPVANVPPVEAPIKAKTETGYGDYYKGRNHTPSRRLERARRKVQRMARKKGRQA